MRSRNPILPVIAAAAFVVAANARAQTVDVRNLANSCAICHGTDGKPPKNGLERLAGMSTREFIDEMHELQRNPANKHLMGYVAGGFSDAEIKAMATYFANMK